jgi:hypothetical protein
MDALERDTRRNDGQSYWLMTMRGEAMSNQIAHRLGLDIIIPSTSKVN